MSDFTRWNEKDDAREMAVLGIEVWTAVPGADENYLISNLGRYASNKKGWRVLRGSQSTTGYVLYTYFDGPTMADRKSMTAQRMVLLAFEGDPPTEEHTDARHLDGCKTNNALPNLSWGTRSENMLDAWAQRRAGKPTSTTNAQSVPNPTFQLTDDVVIRGLKLHDDGKLNINDLAFLWGVSKDVASRIVHGETWQHIERPEKAKAKKQKRRTAERKAEIMALVAEGKNAAEINEELGETLTPQAVYYYKKQLKPSHCLQTALGCWDGDPCSCNCRECS